MSTTTYIVITPVRNEAQFLPNTVRSVAAQTVKPARWVIVDDGSNDQTGTIAAAAATQFSWITALKRVDRGYRHAGAGVIEAFYDGYRIANSENWNYLVKLDGDITLPSNYFEECFKHFDGNKSLGVAGGIVCKRVRGELVPESKNDPAFHVRGATKIYRHQCWHDIGGLLSAPGWDTLDEVKANMLGWSTLTFPDIRIEHHRPAGGAYGTWRNWVKNGIANYIAGYHPVFMAVKCLKRSMDRPFLVAAVGLGYGFLSGYLRGVPRVDDPELIRYFRRQQLARLTGRASLWSRSAASY